MKYILVGDVHGKFDDFYGVVRAIRQADTDSTIIQVGDMGIGFGKRYAQPDENVLFIHGNHDNPELCKSTNGFVGRYGVCNEHMWFCSGAMSIDRRHRTQGFDWWSDEQLSYKEAQLALSMYNGQRLVVTHDCPSSVYHKLGIESPEKSLTSTMLDLILEHEIKPKVWVFGHHHKSRSFYHKGTLFICLNELETLEMEIK